jgi:hypothetical protein
VKSLIPRSPRPVSALEQLRDGAKADLVAASLGEAVKMCIEATGIVGHGETTTNPDQLPTTSAA